MYTVCTCIIRYVATNNIMNINIQLEHSTVNMCNYIKLDNSDQ